MQTPPLRKTYKLAFACLTAASLSAYCRKEPPAPWLTEASINRIVNTVTVTQGEDRWNDKLVSDRQLTQLLAKSLTIDPQPEWRFQPDGSTTYDALARILQIIRDSNATKVGFVGNEAYSPSDSPTG